MRTLKTFITFLVALCAIFCVFTGCKTAEVETTTQNLENTVEVPVEAPVEDESVVEPTKDFLGRGRTIAKSCTFVLIKVRVLHISSDERAFNCLLLYA